METNKQTNKKRKEGNSIARKLNYFGAFLYKVSFVFASHRLKSEFHKSTQQDKHIMVLCRNMSRGKIKTKQKRKRNQTVMTTNNPSSLDALISILFCLHFVHQHHLQLITLSKEETWT